jgi:hypothetical protein
MYFIKKSDFVAPYPALSQNLNEKDILPFIWKSQNEKLREILGEDFYKNILEYFSNVKKVDSIVVGTTTIINVDNVFNIVSGDYFTIYDLQGTINVLNNKRLKVLSVGINYLEIDYNSTGLAYVSGGLCKEFATESNEALLNICKPFLIYCTLSKYYPYSNLKNTASGQMIHQVGEAVIPSDKQLGIISNLEAESSDFYEKQIKEYLKKNTLLYPLYKRVNEQVNTTNILPIRSNDTNWNSGRVF